jgi:light-regulated signal transduction histidine kinase (bacteriophytochrome)
VTFASARDVTDLKAARESLQRVHAELEDRVKERTAALELTNGALARSKTEVTKLNQQLERRLRDLSASNQELEAFTYSVSHDLRAPLRHVDGFSKILLEEYGAQLPEEARPLLDRVRQATQRMGRMVDELLELSRTSRREPERRLTGLRQIVDEAIADLAPEIAGREVEWRISELPFADCDPALIRQVLVNLLSNSLKFSRTRARAVIEVGQAEADGAIFVRDNGVGFSMKYADKLFGAFQRLHRQEDFEGTGIGLAIVQRIVRKHGGRIWVEAALDQGATFYFTLAPSSERVAEPPVPKEEVQHVA